MTLLLKIVVSGWELRGFSDSASRAFHNTMTVQQEGDGIALPTRCDECLRELEPFSTLCACTGCTGQIIASAPAVLSSTEHDGALAWLSSGRILMVPPTVRA
ncbi:hypothetical protein DPSP01_013937 [Paraphaeosphaeria sporulosa]